MYYEEQWVDGALCWRTSPDGAWTRYTANELAHRYESAEKRASDAQATVEALQAEKLMLERGVSAQSALIDDLQSQLIQRTAALEAVQHERDEANSHVKFLGATKQANGSFCLDMKKYHARYRCGRHRDDPWKGIDTEIDCFVCLKHALDAERAKVPGYEGEIRKAYTEAADWQVRWKHAQAELDAERARADRLFVDRRDLLAVTSTEGMSCSEWMMRTATAERKVDELTARLAQLQALVRALPVVDVQEVSVWLSPDESGWFVSKRPAFPAGLYWAKFRTQAEADSFRALLAYRATLAATTPAAKGGDDE